MAHSCRSMLCDEPHYDNHNHPGDCLCKLCHEHDWMEWNVYPQCGGCLNQLACWIHENTDFTGCPIAMHCDYSPACEEQYQIEIYGKVARPSRKVANA